MANDIHWLDPAEQKEINYKIEYEVAKSHYNMIKLGSITNAISGIFVVFILYHQTNKILLFSWYAALLLTSFADYVWAVWFQKDIDSISVLRKWRQGFYLIFGILSLIWGSIGFLFYTNDAQYQIYILAFLLAVLVGFSFSSITDFRIAAICIAALLVPTILYRVFQGANNIATYGQDKNLNIGISISLIIMGLFLLIVCYIGSKLVKRFFYLSFANVALSEKLEGMNKFLEQRVRERTVELENSLKLVTYQATHDLLTELPNQRLLREYMQKAIVSANQENRLFAVVFLTINEIEKINDGLGHQAGDLVIKTIAQRLQKMFSLDLPSGKQFTVTLSRKDVFVILIEPVTTIEEIERSAEQIFLVFEEPVYTEQQVIKLTGSIGASVYPRNGRDIKSLLMNADAAMLRAKLQGGNNFNMYHSEINADISKQLEMEINLHSAVKNSEFMLHFQPFYDIKKRKISGMEALVRWESPSLGRISPGDFIPLAEANGIIIPLGEWVYRTACHQIKLWHQLGFTDLKIAVNLSAKQLQQKHILLNIERILEESNLDPSTIEFELTESEAFLDTVIPVIKQIKDLGFGLSIDDFGTGYSGLTNLKVVTIDKLKIDQSFIKDVTVNEESNAIVTNTIALAKQMNIKVCAEGVETKEQFEFLEKNGCDIIQGYFISPPVTADVFTELLANQSNLAV